MKHGGAEEPWVVLDSRLPTGVVFDPETIAPEMPEVVNDLPAGARRLLQRARGIAATGHAESLRSVDARLGRERLARGDEVLVRGHLVRRFFRDGGGGRSVTEVVATEVKKLEQKEED